LFNIDVNVIDNTEYFICKSFLLLHLIFYDDKSCRSSITVLIL